MDKWHYTRKAVEAFDALHPKIDEMIVDSAMKFEEWDRLHKALDIMCGALFYADCRRNDVPNSLDHCMLVSIKSLRNLVDNGRLLDQYGTDTPEVKK